MKKFLSVLVLILTATVSQSVFAQKGAIEDSTITATIPFQGYNETSPVYGKLQYRIFYHTNNGNTQKILVKPIIISDGFDPGDTRKIQKDDYAQGTYIDGVSHSIEDLMKYPSCTDPTKLANPIDTLIAKGYDVVVVNYPTYVASNGKTIDGGGDYIERNAMNMIALIQYLNGRLQGSTEQLVVIGPSMGGQITRYALAYMEKQFASTGNPIWKHNTRLWISVDSPHLGANIPLGAQGLVYELSSQSDEAKHFYDDLLGSAAAKQQLIEDFEPTIMNGVYPVNFYTHNPASLNGRTISQGYSVDKGSSFFQQYYNNQFANGLTSSKGYPINLRKISLVNGSVTGNKAALGRDGSNLNFGNPGDEALNIQGFVNIAGSDRVASFEGNSLPAYGNTSKLYHYYTSHIFNSKDISTTVSNMNTRGSMDVVPGGFTTSWNDLNSSILGTYIQSISWVNNWIIHFNFGAYPVNWEPRTNIKVHSFIPTFSALGIKQPEQDWSQPLNNRNLSCTGETPFDSYFGHDVNTEHTSFDCESVTWLLKEIDGVPQAPWYPSPATLTGPNRVCLGATATYTFGTDLCSVPGGTDWGVPSIFQVISKTPNTLTVQAIANGRGVITAPTNAVSKSMYVGVGYLPDDFSLTGNNGSSNWCTNQTMSFGVSGVPGITGAVGSNYNWTLPTGWSMINNGGSYVAIKSPSSSNPPSGTLSVSFSDVCGSPITLNQYLTYNSSACTVIPYSISPNPAGSTITIACTSLQNNCNIAAVQITNLNGTILSSQSWSYTNQQVQMPVYFLTTGTYIARIYNGTQWFSKQFMKQ